MLLTAIYNMLKKNEPYNRLSTTWQTVPRPTVKFRWKKLFTLSNDKGIW